jgi:hypothetical protein
VRAENITIFRSCPVGAAAFTVNVKAFPRTVRDAIIAGVTLGVAAGVSRAIANVIHGTGLWPTLLEAVLDVAGISALFCAVFVGRYYITAARLRSQAAPQYDATAPQWNHRTGGASAEDPH